MPSLEYDPDKSGTNPKKHGIDFDAAKGIWEDTDLVEISVGAADEPRSLVIGRIGSRHCGPRLSPTGDRIYVFISLGKSRSTEVKFHEG
uniref:Uncharacterized protein n=1 Tax=Candidatus Kentrum sp. TC TaxID=2126339 RepID=A0A450YEU7_9GAMM|nr:MAG: hypothetical protein BECKTC1821E_GA0114239_100618 [Candidatus Kentron sp. TC]